MPIYTLDIYKGLYPSAIPQKGNRILVKEYCTVRIGIKGLKGEHVVSARYQFDHTLLALFQVVSALNYIPMENKIYITG